MGRGSREVRVRSGLGVSEREVSGLKGDSVERVDK